MHSAKFRARERRQDKQVASPIWLFTNEEADSLEKDATRGFWSMSSMQSTSDPAFIVSSHALHMPRLSAQSFEHRANDHLQASKPQ